MLVNHLSKDVVFNSDFDSVLEDILSLSCCFESVRWSHVKRVENFVAHHLARLVPFGVEQTWENHCPAKVALYVLSDIFPMS